MIAPQERNTNVRLLAYLIDDDDTNDSDYRFLVNGAKDDRTFEPILLGELPPPFPTGDWNHGYVARDPESGKATFVRTETVQFAGISDSRASPNFLGHFTEGKDGRVVGFIAEWVEGTRAAGPADINDCKKALGRLHELGIKLGDINKHNFLMQDRHDVVLVDFETAKQDCSPVELEDEMSTLKSSLEDTSFRGGVEPAYE
ncbi:hypothetical protein FGADI_6619 [Fusarium gaditjirri]|uniref:Protein kinase domain-containing protein n=1 Tax=Fusarium gaditjirri TaxID=282569 RepID=A0A8H4WVQ4_9HYPO|nr:hypothetical protein FGADI_6619 [Fusarium gaditjirri]